MPRTSRNTTRTATGKLDPDEESAMKADQEKMKAEKKEKKDEKKDKKDDKKG